ncbi:Helicase conserved C-terminal domain-containing protein [Devosia enhydra]|uniref:Helicase conserved C-terminal domain-containing protein n=1 Tax=Devosia enhydra TaxID=665118 RepID=A0A1K2HTZ3_9HYPH|nr:helicase-related protein [Devosia enhydra]SFZ81760.1 Helicase conserved C-terminal domain-containing protein [Devosia enhydra]
MSAPKPFQAAAVDAALSAFANQGGRRRFLVADEVGLGKTIVAKEVARRMSEDGERPLVIYYIANGHAVSHQNKGRVVSFLDEPERKAAVATPDRLSLIAVSKRSDKPVLIYALTPATSFPGARARLTGGRKEERAFLKVLLDRAYPAFARDLDPAVLRLSVGASWDWLVEDAERKLAAAPPHLTRRFREALAAEFGEPVRERLEQALYGDEERKIKPLKPTTFVGHLRRALALATLRHQPPDLVILDEFQRYRQLLDEKDADPLLKALLEPYGSVARPAILLLSATPYRLLSTRWEEAQGALAHAELLELIEFLAGSDVRDRAKSLFSDFGDKLRDIAVHAEATDPRLEIEINEAAGLRDALRALLTPVMSRTERDSVASGDPLAGTQFLAAEPIAEDFQIYRHLADSFPEDVRYEALPYWSSVPLPAQSLGPRYAAWKRATIKAAPKLTKMTRERRNKLDAPASWPDAKLRALSAAAPAKLLSLPWVAPSLPWWPLAGGWKGIVADPKLLMFSRFRATPPSVAALLSFGVEASCLPRQRGGYEKAYRRRRFKLAAVPGPVMAAFHPSPWLIRHTDPLAKAGETIGAIRKQVRRQILAALPKGIIEKDTVKARRRHRSIGRTLAAIERAAGLSEQSAAAWSSAVGEDRAARSAVLKWRQTPTIERLSPAELNDLVDYAIGAPGVVLGRALLRHDPTILDPARYSELVQLSWQGLRAYLDNPVILSSLPGKNAVDQVMGAVVDGGFESVLDEHFWLRAQNLPEGAAGLAKDLHSSLGLRAGSFSFHSIGGPAHKIPVRSHVAVPFGDAETEPAGKVNGALAPSAPARPDEVRRSFNTPFWPHVLATTSVGQEGLDFHPWCSHVVHWDLSSNPLDLEQREGRVQRYAGLAVRRRLSNMLREEALGRVVVSGGSAWHHLQRQAEKLVDVSGLRPWWVLENAEISRHVFERPFGRDMSRFAQLREQRMIYRLALGQPNQEDFIEILARGGEATRVLLSPLVLDLSAMGLRQAPEPAAPDCRSATRFPLPLDQMG